MTETVQLLVMRRGLDPVAWTALHALRELKLPAVPRALGRADLWEFRLPAGTGADELMGWAVSANWFANPSRDAVRWRRRSGEPTGLAQAAVRADGGVGSRGDGAYLAVTWIDALEAPAHEKAVHRHTGAAIEVRRGHVWWLGVGDASAATTLEAAGGDPGGGLLVNPHSQRYRIFPDNLPLPMLFAEIWDTRRHERAGGAL
jgi:hypothetical protein